MAGRVHTGPCVELRVGVAGAHRRHAYAERFQLLVQRFPERAEKGLGRRVGRVVRQRLVRRQRRDVQDRAVAATHLFPFKPRKPTRIKQMPYESGMDPIGTARMQFDIKFYLIAILFLVFDVELLFLYPWAVIAYGEGGDKTWKLVFGTIVFIEILIFLATFVIAYVYAWKKGVFQWR